MDIELFYWYKKTRSIFQLFTGKGEGHATAT